MFRIKTLTIEKASKFITRITKGKITNDYATRQLMKHFNADAYGHRANINKADLGYGWIHYSFIRMIKPKRILCVGSRHGYIPAVLAQACKDNNKGCVDFVDPGYNQEDGGHWTGVGYWKTEAGRNCFVEHGLKNWIILYLMTSKEYAKKNNRKYEYVYIDGDHSYKGVSLDHKLFWPRLRKYGFMLFHDVCIQEKLPEGQYGVYKLWREISNKHSFIIPFEGSGLGVVQKLL